MQAYVSRVRKLQEKRLDRLTKFRSTVSRWGERSWDGGSDGEGGSAMMDALGDAVQQDWSSDDAGTSMMGSLEIQPRKGAE